MRHRPCIWPAPFVDEQSEQSCRSYSRDQSVAALASTGGKIVCSLAALPTWGPGRLFMRDDGNVHDTDAEKKLLKTEHPGFVKIAEKMVQSGVGIDFFMAAPSGGYLDIATIGRSMRKLS